MGSGEDLVVQRREGLYCPPGDFYLDPWRPVERAVITHAHADHSRRGHGRYLAAAPAEGVLRSRLGDQIDLQTLPYGEAIEHRGVRLSFHPAGHVLGSAQVRLEHRGRVWVASGDYHLAGSRADPREDNATCAPFEPVRCHCFITESTFGLPIYRWQPQAELFGAIDAWWAGNADAGRASLLMGYSFGKAQRILKGVDRSIGPIFVHGAVEPLNRAYRAAGIDLPATPLVTEVQDKALFRRALVVAPPSVQGSVWSRRLGEHSDAFASGWMQLRGARRRRAVDRGFVLSDHADWPGLIRAIAETGAERVIVTHGYEAVMVRWLSEQGLEASAFETEYGDDDDDEPVLTPALSREREREKKRRCALSRWRERVGVRARREALSQLFAELDATTATGAKVEALKRYFGQAAPRDAAWAVYFLAGGKPRQVVPNAVLWALACRQAGIDDWLFDASYQAVGDFAETVAHVLPPPAHESDLGLAEWVEERLLALRGLSPEEQSARVAGYWDELDAAGRFLLNKLIGGSFRVGVSKLLVQRALAEAAGVDAKRVAQRMMGYTDARSTPSAERYLQLTAATEAGPLDRGQPYPFFLAHQLDLPEAELESRLASPGDWIVEWKYDGIRAQVVRRAGEVWLWSRGEELITERFPEIVALARPLPDGTVLDGEIVVWKDGKLAPFALLQQRIGRKLLTKKVLADAPVAFIAYDLLEEAGIDLRERPQAERRARLERLLEAHPALRLSPVESGASWSELAALRGESRGRGVEGFMLKHRDARYGTGRRKQDDLAGGTWWKWKIDPLSVDCVLVYAQAGHGRRASVYTDYTFAVWNRAPADAVEAAAAIEAIARRQAPAPDDLQLVAFAKAYSGLTDVEFKAVDRIIRRDTLEKFGPVRSVRPSLVFELGFEGINRSGRHKSGIAVRFPRMLRLRADKPVHEADTLAALEALLALQHGAG